MVFYILRKNLLSWGRYLHFLSDWKNTLTFYCTDIVSFVKNEIIFSDNSFRPTEVCVKLWTENREDFGRYLCVTLRTQHAAARQRRRCELYPCGNVLLSATNDNVFTIWRATATLEARIYGPYIRVHGWRLWHPYIRPVCTGHVM